MKKKLFESLKVTTISLIVAPVTWSIIRLFLQSQETIDISSYVALAVLGGLQNIIPYTVILLICKYFEEGLCSMSNNKFKISARLLSYLLLVFLFPIVKLFFWQWEFYKKEYDIVLVVTIIVSDVIIRDLYWRGRARVR